MWEGREDGMKISKEFRILDLYQRFSEGHMIEKRKEAFRYEVSERSIQRDIDTIRSFLINRAVLYDSQYRYICYDRERKVFFLEDVCEYRNKCRNLFLSLYSQKQGHL